MEYLKDYTEYAVIGVLIFMSFLSIGFGLERYIFLSGVNLSKYKKKGELENDLTNNLTIISIIGSNAPYVGLLGTVIGIMVTFYDIGENGQIDTMSVMVGLALALKATALGIVVAIPSIMIYNGLVRKVEVLISLWNDLNEN